MGDDTGDKNEREARKRLEEAKARLNALPPDVVREQIRARPGLMNTALDTIVEIAQQGDDPEAREGARQLLEDYDLLILLAVADDEDIRVPDEDDNK